MESIQIGSNLFLSLLRSHYSHYKASKNCNLLQDPRCYNALAELYANLDEEDMLYGLQKMCANMSETRHAFAWAQHGVMDTAQEALTNALEKADPKTASGESQNCSHSYPMLNGCFMSWSDVRMFYVGLKKRSCKK